MTDDNSPDGMDEFRKMVVGNETPKNEDSLKNFREMSIPNQDASPANESMIEKLKDYDVGKPEPSRIHDQNFEEFKNIDLDSLPRAEPLDATPKGHFADHIIPDEGVQDYTRGISTPFPPHLSADENLEARLGDLDLDAPPSARVNGTPIIDVTPQSSSTEAHDPLHSTKSHQNYSAPTKSYAQRVAQRIGGNLKRAAITGTLLALAGFTALTYSDHASDKLVSLFTQKEAYVSQVKSISSSDTNTTSIPPTDTTSTVAPAVTDVSSTPETGTESTAVPPITPEKTPKDMQIAARTWCSWYRTAPAQAIPETAKSEPAAQAPDTQMAARTWCSWYKAAPRTAVQPTPTSAAPETATAPPAQPEQKTLETTLQNLPASQRLESAGITVGMTKTSDEGKETHFYGMRKQSAALPLGGAYTKLDDLVTADGSILRRGMVATPATTENELSGPNANKIAKITLKEGEYATLVLPQTNDVVKTSSFKVDTRLNTTETIAVAQDGTLEYNDVKGKTVRVAYTVLGKDASNKVVASYVFALDVSGDSTTPAAPAAENLEKKVEDANPSKEKTEYKSLTAPKAEGEEVTTPYQRPAAPTPTPTPVETLEDALARIKALEEQNRKEELEKKPQYEQPKLNVNMRILNSFAADGTYKIFSGETLSPNGYTTTTTIPQYDMKKATSTGAPVVYENKVTVPVEQKKQPIIKSAIPLE